MPAAQVAVKQRVLEDNLWHLGKVKPELIAAPHRRARPGATATARGCRCACASRRATVLIGFHERKSRYVADMRYARAAAACQRHADAAAGADRAWTRAKPARRSNWPAATT
jgi:tRNA/tmRNA/rRNA uracil-C5-methylase (TrmA/RlmC/RlmD family)